ncbi:MAG TPA: hypothetical protein VMB73_25505 [Acetobacteraceae bacterium]|nr:hypothetical protein [Acetobacteraceae bacterium]
MSETEPQITAASRHTRGKRVSPLFMPLKFTPRARDRFVRARVRALLAHLGGHASVSQQILVHRAIRCEWDLLRLDRRLDAEGELSEHAIRVRGALENRLRLDLVALGLQPPQPREPTWQEALASIHAMHQRPEADDAP